MLTRGGEAVGSWTSLAAGGSVQLRPLRRRASRSFEELNRAAVCPRLLIPGHTPHRGGAGSPHTHTRAHAGHGSAKAAAAPTPAAARSAHTARSAHARTAVQPGKGTRRCDVTGTNLSQNPLRPRLRASASVRKPLNYALSTEKLYRM